MMKIRITARQTGNVINRCVEFSVLATDGDSSTVLGSVLRDDFAQASDRWRIFPAHHAELLTTCHSKSEAVRFMANTSMPQYFSGDVEVTYGGRKWQLCLPEKV